MERVHHLDQRKLLRDAFPQARVEEIPIHNGRGCTLLELAQDRCRWPINDPGTANFCYCGNEAFDSLPYCTGHARLHTAARAGAARNSAARRLSRHRDTSQWAGAEMRGAPPVTPNEVIAPAQPAMSAMTLHQKNA